MLRDGTVSYMRDEYEYEYLYLKKVQTKVKIKPEQNIYTHHLKKLYSFNQKYLTKLENEKIISSDSGRLFLICKCFFY